MNQDQVEPGQIYQNWKTRAHYEVVMLATDSETDEDVVVYRDLATGRAFVRPLRMFCGFKEVDGQQIKRFVLITQPHVPPAVG